MMRHESSCSGSANALCAEAVHKTKATSQYTRPQRCKYASAHTQRIELLRVYNRLVAGWQLENVRSLGWKIKTTNITSTRLTSLFVVCWRGTFVPLVAFSLCRSSAFAFHFVLFDEPVLACFQLC